jgi:predicted permease
MADIRGAFRQLKSNPAFSISVILILAPGIGANTAIFSVVQGVLLAPFPYVHPERLVFVRENNLQLKREMGVSYPDLLDWQRAARSFEQVAGVRFRTFDLTSPGTPEHLEGKEITAGFFETLGVNLSLGREFSPDEDQPHGASVVLIGSRLFKNRFAAGVNPLGKSITLDGIARTIVGVVPREFRSPGGSSQADVYTPLAQGDPLIVNDRSIHPGIAFIARLKPGMTEAQASEEMGAIQIRLNQLYPEADRGLGADVVSLDREIVGDISGTLLMLLGAVGLVLLIACANAANLLLARSAGRSREFAIRSALGASRVRIVSQLIAESLLLSLAGGFLGLAIAKWGVSAALAAMEASLPRGGEFGLNLPVFLFAVGVSVTVGILFGLGPALQSSNTDLQASLKEGGRGFTAGNQRAQRLLVVIQMALTLVLLAGASLLFHTIYNLSGANPGFDPRGIITFKVGLAPSSANTGPAIRTAYLRLIERVREIPGVQSADFTTLLPLSGLSNAGPFLVGSQAPSHISQAPRALFYETGPDYLLTMGIPLLRGRFFTLDDTTKSEPVVVIDSVLARAFFQDRNPVGQTMVVPHWGTARIIGVVGHVRHWGLGDPDQYTQNQIYISFYQLLDEWAPAFRGDITLAVRTPLDRAAVLPAIQKAVFTADSRQPVYSIRTMSEIVSESMASQRFPMILLSAFAALALLLASVGIYAVISYSMTQRVREVGIRMALGAMRADVLRMIVGQGLRLVLAGSAIGAVVALILMRLLSSFSGLLYGVGAGDPVTWIAVSFVLLSTALLASYLPARRAANVDPMVALRHE